MQAPSPISILNDIMSLNYADRQKLFKVLNPNKNLTSQNRKTTNKNQYKLNKIDIRKHILARKTLKHE